MKKVEKIKDQLCYKRLERGKFFDINGSMFEPDVFILNCDKHEKVIVSMTLFTCNLDILQSYISLKLYWRLTDMMNRYPDSIYERGTKILNCFNTKRVKYNEKTFKLLALWESFVIGCIVSKTEKDIGFAGLFNHTKEKITEIVGREYEEFAAVLLPKNTSLQEERLMLELLGINKSFGHPCLDAKTSFATLKENSTKESILNMDTIRNAHGIFVRNFAYEYKKQKKRWPLMRHIPEPLRLPILKNEYPNSTLCKSLDLWHEIEFSKIFDYDFSPDTSEILKDSSLASPFSEWFSNYDPCAFSNIYGKKKPKFLTGKARSTTRTMKRFLVGHPRETEIKIKNKDLNYQDLDHSTAIVCRKERELKLEGRSYLKQAYEQRLCQTSMELNLSKNVMKYFKEQTMTEGELEQLKRMGATVHKQGKNLEVLNLDLSKWNSTFRHTLVYFFGKSIDQMFGFENLFRNNHYWFLTCHVFTNSRLFPPDYDPITNRPIPGDYYYNNHFGGFE